MIFTIRVFMKHDYSTIYLSYIKLLCLYYEYMNICIITMFIISLIINTINRSMTRSSYLWAMTALHNDHIHIFHQFFMLHKYETVSDLMYL